MKQLIMLQPKAQMLMEKLANELNAQLERALIEALRDNKVKIRNRRELVGLVKSGRISQLEKDGVKTFLLDSSIALLIVPIKTNVEIEQNLFKFTIEF